MDDHGLLTTVQSLANCMRVYRLKLEPNMVDLYTYVAEHGRLWTPAPLPKGIRYGRVKQCFHNCQKLATRRRSLQYVEGYAFSGQLAFPIHHAWCVKGDTVIDPTWDPPGIAYLGIVFDMDFVAEQIAGNTQSISVIDNWEKGFPLLRRTP